jgi:osmotically-inducible protein OsmY
MRADTDIRADVESELQRDPHIDDSLIAVIVRGDVVTLTGQTGHSGAKWAAEEAAKRVQGVRAIANEIQVKLTDGAMRSDTDLAEAVANALRDGMLTGADRIQCVVQDGIVTLCGDAPSGEQKLAAEKMVRRLRGVTGVLNAITTTTPISATR